MKNKPPFYRPICHVQREIYYLAQKLPESEEKQAILERIQEAHAMAKKMDKRLKELSPRYNRKTWIHKFEPIEMEPKDPNDDTE